jgi:SAM-dependent methyltransferase
VSSRLAAWLAAAEGADEEFVERAWRDVLRREVEPEARERALERLRDGTLSRATLLHELVRSEEYQRVRLLDDAVAHAAGLRRAPREVAGPARPRSLRAPARSDERPIEIPWCLARYDGEPRVLDVGYAFAEPAYLAGLVALGTHELVGVDLAEAEVPGLRSVVADVRELPFRAGSFDLILCISTLEHVGLDNTVYGLAVEQDEETQERALLELHRVLAPRGRLLVTVPTGEDQNLGSQVQRRPDVWIALFEQSGFLVFEDELYELADDGWRTTASVAGAHYGERGPGASAVLCAELRPWSVGQSLRLVVRDLRHREEPRRSTRPG